MQVSCARVAPQSPEHVSALTRWAGSDVAYIPPLDVHSAVQQQQINRFARTRAQHNTCSIAAAVCGATLLPAQSKSFVVTNTDAYASCCTAWHSKRLFSFSFTLIARFQFYPELGPYSSRNSTVMTKHFQVQQQRGGY